MSVGSPPRPARWGAEEQGSERSFAAGEAEPNGLCDDAMWEDYNRADPAAQQMLIRMWGEPRR